MNGGSILRLSCIIEGAPSLSGAPSSVSTSGQAEFVFWYRNGKLLNYGKGQRQRVSLILPSSAQQTNSTESSAPKNKQITKDGSNSSVADDANQNKYESRLEILSVNLGDSGNYTCHPSHAAPDVIQVFVIMNSE